MLDGADHWNIVCPSHENRKILRRRGNARRRLGRDDLEIDREPFAQRQKIKCLVRNLEEQCCRNVLADRSRNRIDRIGNSDRINSEHLRRWVVKIQRCGELRCGSRRQIPVAPGKWIRRKRDGDGVRGIRVCIKQLQGDHSAGYRCGAGIGCPRKFGNGRDRGCCKLRRAAAQANATRARIEQVCQNVRIGVRLAAS